MTSQPSHTVSLGVGVKTGDGLKDGVHVMVGVAVGTVGVGVFVGNGTVGVAVGGVIVPVGVFVIVNMGFIPSENIITNQFLG